MEEQRKSFLDNWQNQLLIFIFATIVSLVLFNYHSTNPSSVTGTGLVGFLQGIAQLPIWVLIGIIVIDALTNACLYALLKKWRGLPRNKRAYEKQLAKKHEIQQTAEIAQRERAQEAKKEGFKTLKEYNTYLDRKNSPGIMGWIGIVFGLLCLSYIVGIFLTWMGGVVVFLYY